MPKGLAKVMQDPAHLWVHASKPEESTAGQSEMWVRGRVLGGSSAVNGMMYVRGQPADYDAIADLSSEDWAWPHIEAAYRALENHELGAAEHRGSGGPPNPAIAANIATSPHGSPQATRSGARVDAASRRLSARRPRLSHTLRLATAGMASPRNTTYFQPTPSRCQTDRAGT